MVGWAIRIDDKRGRGSDSNRHPEKPGRQQLNINEGKGNGGDCSVELEAQNKQIVILWISRLLATKLVRKLHGNPSLPSPTLYQTRHLLQNCHRKDLTVKTRLKRTILMEQRSIGRS
ncbi:hypothetical protein Ddye_018411 [Dipteronia dyeriana]|uniref:Uncharacterized protein n=1 Tax=Dipteronia dyeriana TaxID=168575 RepID=A0AAD9UB73_9ROSI|nr:hypothetical protein Ddye_018411 [Dipteronia dyeriana]